MRKVQALSEKQKMHCLRRHCVIHILFGTLGWLYAKNPNHLVENKLDYYMIAEVVKPHWRTGP